MNTSVIDGNIKNRQVPSHVEYDKRTLESVEPELYRGTPVHDVITNLLQVCYGYVSLTMPENKHQVVGVCDKCITKLVGHLKNCLDENVPEKRGKNTTLWTAQRVIYSRYYYKTRRMLKQEIVTKNIRIRCPVKN